MRTIRVFPRKTSMTPQDDYAFVGDPPILRPEADMVHVSCAFTWDIPTAERLAGAWGQYYPVRVGGPAFNTEADGFTPAMYVKRGVSFTSRGCNNECPWCLVARREGQLRELPIVEGHIVEDNNLLQCSKLHIGKVMDMLRSQHRIEFAGGLDSRLLTNSLADDLRSLRIRHLFFASDTKASLRSLEAARRKLDGFTRNQLRCYVLMAFGGETTSEAEERLEAVWGLGFMPFAQLYQPPDHYINYSPEWRALARTWSRPAAMKCFMRGLHEGELFGVLQGNQKAIFRRKQ